ncbi:MAG: mannose-1-phosphate guanylyltransferase/mannose-6-phosphate isomerase [Candidatus Sedimenticola sp. (ex Thyasira tokunagai)]
MIVPTILSGGSGTRLWPLSRKAYPKQFLPLVDDLSLFQSTVQRVAGFADCSNPLIVCNEEHRFLVAEQLRNIEAEASAILLEPEAKNTAPALACAALAAQERSEDAVLLVLPSDHLIQNVDLFLQAIEKGLSSAAQGKLATFGIVPTSPATGFGYIRYTAEKLDQVAACPVDEFVEKPPLETAKEYLKSGDYLWNSGMFLFKAATYLDELQRHAPEILQQCRISYDNRGRDLDFERLEKDAFSACPSESIDYAVMEKTDRAAVIPLDAGWSDVGAWTALSDVSDPDSNGNVMIGDVVAEGVSNSYLRSEHRLLAGIGLDQLVVVETADAVLVADKSRIQDVKLIVDRLKKAGREECSDHVRVYRPWGSYETIDECSRFKVKRILVKPGASLSLQMHHHRAEHWVVVNGTAKVTRGEDDLVLSEDESVYIPLGTKHRLENPGIIPLEIIEVQTGSYLGEDDIVSYSDVYGR